MKNPKNIRAFMDAVLARIAACRKLGVDVSWRTQDHLDTLAAVLQASPEEIPALLEDAYNVSAWQQTLERTFKKEGLFQRSSGKRTASSEMDDLHAKYQAMAMESAATVPQAASTIAAMEAEIALLAGPGATPLEIETAVAELKTFRAQA